MWSSRVTSSRPLLYFFFSSRRRHTRWTGDWSSDVCSSDLARSGAGPALVHLTVPRLCSHSGPDNQRGYRSEEEIAADFTRDPLPKLRRYLVPRTITAAAWREIEAEVQRDVDEGLRKARARPPADPDTVRRFVFEEPDSPAILGGLTLEERAALDGSEAARDDGEVVRFAEAVRRTLRRELEVNPKCVVFGED